MRRFASARVSALLFLPLFALTLNQSLRADPAVPAPWLQPGNAEKYVFVGKAVWDADTGKLVSPTGAPTLIVDARPVVGAPDRIFEIGMNKGIPSMPGIGQILSLDKVDRHQPTLDGKPSPDLGSYNGFWAAPDHRRVVWIQGGDYWRGEVDWKEVKIVNRKQVTSLGVFTPLNPPVLWWGNLLFVSGEFDKEKPIVKINLDTGATEEMPTHRCFIGRQLSARVSPSGCRIFLPTSSVIYCYDARTGKPSMIRNKFEDIYAKRSQAMFTTIPPLWIDDDTVFSLDGQGYLARIDLRNNRMDIIQQPDPAVYASSHINRQIVLPGGRFVDTATSTGGGHGGPEQPTERYLLELTTGKHIPLPFDGKSTGTWLDDNIYLYTVTQGGLSKVGTWAFNRTANTNKRLFGKSIDSQRMAYLKKQKQIWAVSQQSGISLVKLDLEGAGSQDLGPCEMMPPFQFPAVDSIDLGFGGASADLWKAPAIDEAAIAPTQPPEPAAGKIKFFETIKDLPADEKEFAESSYDYADTQGMFVNYCDPAKVAMKMVDIHKSQPQTPVASLYVSTKFEDCADRDHITRWGRAHALEFTVSDTKLTPEQRYAIADKVGPCVADAYFKQEKPELNKMEMLFQQCLTEARGGPVAAGQQTAQPKPPQQQTQAGAPPQNAPATKPAQPNQPQVDKAAAKAKKAKDAADKLKGIFGGH